MGFDATTNKYAFKSFRVKLTQPGALYEVVAFATEDSEVRYVGLVAGEYFIRCLLEAFAEEEAI